MRIVNLFLAGVVLHTYATTAFALEATLEMSTLKCDKTTEHGEDEVFVLYSAVGPGSSEKAGRRPANEPHNEAGHWNMNDHGSKQEISDKTIWKGDIAEGQSVDIEVNVMEEDGGTTKSVIDDLGLDQVFDQFGIPIPNIKDTDDYIGSVQIHIWNSDGTMYFEVESDDTNTTKDDGLSKYGNPRYKMKGTGSEYRFYCKVATPSGKATLSN